MCCTSPAAACAARPSASSTAELEFRHHVFPIAGAFSWGGDGLALRRARARATATRARTSPPPRARRWWRRAAAWSRPSQYQAERRRPLRRPRRRGRGPRLRLHAPAHGLDPRAPRASACARASASARWAARAAPPARTSTSRSGSAAGSRAATRSTRCRCCRAGPVALVQRQAERAAHPVRCSSRPSRSARRAGARTGRRPAGRPRPAASRAASITWSATRSASAVITSEPCAPSTGLGLRLRPAPARGRGVAGHHEHVVAHAERRTAAVGQLRLVEPAARAAPSLTPRPAPSCGSASATLSIVRANAPGSATSARAPNEPSTATDTDRSPVSWPNTSSSRSMS